MRSEIKTWVACTLTLAIVSMTNGATAQGTSASAPTVAVRGTALGDEVVRPDKADNARITVKGALRRPTEASATPTAGASEVRNALGTRVEVVVNENLSYQLSNEDKSARDGRRVSEPLRVPTWQIIRF